MIENLELYIHAGIAEKGATEFFRALSKVCMELSQQADSTGAKQTWLSLSARSVRMIDECEGRRMGSPFVLRRIG